MNMSIFECSTSRFLSKDIIASVFILVLYTIVYGANHSPNLEIETPQGS